MENVKKISMVMDVINFVPLIRINCITKYKWPDTGNEIEQAKWFGSFVKMDSVIILEDVIL